ncbi:hypothetical protein [Mycobacterium arosiense]|uniref:hypothetical protein n=1 Tax=Mycobacterium arosiense TaxID=425468 RepID=UPI001301C459|nr:hypothetical protein [Mycobacterium arosiense]
MLPSHLLPPPSPATSAADITKLFIANSIAIRAACIAMMIAFCFWATFGAAVSVQIRRMESGLPVITYASIALVGVNTVILELIALTWGVAAFRSESLDPEITRTINDWVWFVFIYTTPPFAIWIILIGVAVFKDHNQPPIYPRWVGYLSVWNGLILMPSTSMIFFKTGPFAWNGIACFWLPLIVFTAWYLTMAVMTLKAIKNDEQSGALRSEPDPGIQGSGDFVSPSRRR